MTFFKNTIIYGLVTMFKSLVPFIFIPILTTVLSPKDYGLLSLIEISVLILLPFIFLNIHGASKVEYFKLNLTELSAYISTALLLSFLSFIFIEFVFFLFKTQLSELFSISKNIIILLPLFAFSRVIITLTLTMLQVMNHAKKFALLSFLQTFIDFTISIILVTQLYYGYIGRLEGIYIAFSIMSLYGFYVLKNMKLLGKINLKKYTKSIFNFGIPLIPHALGAVIINMSDRYFISYYIDTAEVGIYTISYQMGAIMLLISVSLNQAWSPFLFTLLKSSTKKDYNKILKYILFIVIFFISSFIIIYSLSDILFSTFVNEKYWEAKKYFFWLLSGFFFQSLYFIFVNFLFFDKKSYVIAMYTIIASILNMLLNYIFIQNYGVLGVAYATLITWIVYFILIATHVAVNWYPKFKKYLKKGKKKIC